YYKNRAGISKKRCLEIIRKKTGALIRASVEAGALCAGVKGKKLRMLSAFGENMGMAFQIKDDLLDILGKFCKIGKSTNNDIREGKATLPLVLALENATSDRGTAIKKAFGNKMTISNIKRVVEFIKQNKGIESAEKTAALYIQKAKSALSQAGLKGSAEKDLLLKMADYMMGRDH
ncbi:MAG: polyprenyl synthetase family protein, partial [Spirochaetia bacterium]|nr:polyprenyl synthetase family protein [Spirochaetia bacterium]